MKTHATTALLLCSLAACSSGGGGGNPPQVQGSNEARFTFDVDLQGITGVLVMDVEVVNSSGVTWDSGVTPDITAVITTGTYIIYTEGELTSPVASYVFTGENDFADFTEPATFATFLVQWIETPQGMTMVVDPFGPAPTSYDCVLTGAELL